MKSRELQLHLRGSTELRGRDFYSLWFCSIIFNFLSWCGFYSLLSCQPRRRIKKNKMKKNKTPRKKEENKNGERRKTDWDQVHCRRYFFTFFTLFFLTIFIFLYFLLFFFFLLFFNIFYLIFEIENYFLNFQYQPWNKTGVFNWWM